MGFAFPLAAVPRRCTFAGQPSGDACRCSRRRRPRPYGTRTCVTAVRGRPEGLPRWDQRGASGHRKSQGLWPFAARIRGRIPNASQRSQSRTASFGCRVFAESGLPRAQNEHLAEVDSRERGRGWRWPILEQVLLADPRPARYPGVVRQSKDAHRRAGSQRVYSSSISQEYTRRNSCRRSLRVWESSRPMRNSPSHRRTRCTRS